MKKIAVFDIELYPKPWSVYQFSWGTAMKHNPSNKWHKCWMYPNAQEIDVEHLDVVLHDNGIEFV